MNRNLNRREFLNLAAGGAMAAVMPSAGCQSELAERKDASAKRPNIIFIMADDMGYGDLGCYGQKHIRTPNIDRLANEGTRFTQCYAGSTVCAPSRSVLMTGLHTGHTRVRGNCCKVGGTVGYKGTRKLRRMNLTDEDQTVAHVLKKADYRTGLVGKWHLGGYNPNAGPLDRGFDEFYGWLTRTWDTQDPFYYETKRYRNRELYRITANEDGKQGVYQTDLCTDEATQFIKNNKGGPFFLYLAYNNPHSPYVVPELGPYSNKDWPEPMKTYAAMIHRLDTCIGKVIQTLKELGIDRKTIVFFCSDNGPRSSSTRTQTGVAEFFDSNGSLHGYKRDMYEGGIRVPMIARWPGKVPAGKTSEAVWYFADVLPTLTDLAGVKPPSGIDGISVLPTLLGKKQNTCDRFLYWEFFERGFQQAVRWRDYKAVRPAPGKPLELYDLAKDLAETHNIAARHPDVIDRIETYLKTARTDSPNWPVKPAKKKK